jgi:LDH2 family malate/lactate/ureidoglycolate dehydrogenase
MNLKAKGEFTVKTTPRPWSEDAQGAVSDHALGRFLLDKQYHGDLDATAEGQMLTAGSPQKGSAAYVAVERVSGTLSGRKGTFMLTHNGTMHNGDLKLLIEVVPDSGTDELAGISGNFAIIITDSKHNYELTYTLTTIQ